MKKILVLLFITAFIYKSSAQTLSIDLAEKCFSLNKKAILDSLKKAGFKNLSDDEILRAEGMQHKDIYDPNGLRKIYFFKKLIGGELCTVTIVLETPECNKVNSIFWNANTKYDVKAYGNQLERLGYKDINDPDIAVFTNEKKGYEIIITLKEQQNEIGFMMYKPSK